MAAVLIEVHDRLRGRVTERRRFEPGTIAEVTFKEEADDGEPIGPVTLHSEARKRRADGAPVIELRPVGQPDPEGVYYAGWMSKRQAQRIAQALAARFQEV